VDLYFIDNTTLGDEGSTSLIGYLVSPLTRPFDPVDCVDERDRFSVTPALMLVCFASFGEVRDASLSPLGAARAQEGPCSDSACPGSSSTGIESSSSFPAATRTFLAVAVAFMADLVKN
jgi:hypothetical protein